MTKKITKKKNKELRDLIRTQGDIKVLSFFLSNKGRIFNQDELINQLGSNPYTIREALATLNKAELIRIVVKQHKGYQYALNEENDWIRDTLYYLETINSKNTK